MQTRYMERSNSLAAGEKRSLDPSSSEEGQPDRKRPALASVIIEALKVDSLQKLCSSLEPVLRRVVSEEVERALAKLGPAKLNGRVSPKQIEGPDGRNLQLHFRSKLSLPLFTGGKVEGEQGTAIHVVIVDANTGHVVTSGPESSIKLDVVLEGDFSNEDDEGWTAEEFESHIVKEREGKRPLLTGDLQVTLKEGVGTLGELTFTDNSSWIRSRKFRLGLRVASGYCDAFRVREAKTDAFTVKDHRGELYKKHYPPALNDEVWRLEKIGKDGSFHKRLTKEGIFTVEEFLRLVVRDPQRLRTILGSGMSNKMWDVLIEHAKTCVLSGKLYVYYPDEMKNISVVFNNIYQLSGLIAGGQYCPVDSLSDGQKVRFNITPYYKLIFNKILITQLIAEYGVDLHFSFPVFVDTLVKKAYDNWMHVIEYDSKSLLGFDQNKGSVGSQTDPKIGQKDPSNSFDQLRQQSIPTAIPHEHPSLNANPGLSIRGYNENSSSRYQMQTQNIDFNAAIHLDRTSLHLHNELINTAQPGQQSGSENVLALGPSQSTAPNFHFGNTSNHISNREFEDFCFEDEIRLRSHEMLEHEDMQHLLRVFSMGGGNGQASFNGNYHNYAYTPSVPASYRLAEDSPRSSGKAVVGWLKLKAALRWGIFVRKKAAERRAQIF